MYFYGCYKISDMENKNVILTQEAIEKEDRTDCV